MQSKAATVEQYLASLPDDRRAALEAVRKVFLANIDRGPDGKSGFIELMGYGMPGFSVPHSIFPPGYHCDPRQPLPYAGFASQKNYMSIYLMCLYNHGEAESEFRRQWEKTGKKLDMGKCCIRFRKLDDLALDVIGATIKRITVKKYIDQYTKALAAQSKDVHGRKIAATKRPTAKEKVTAKKSPATKAPAPARAQRPSTRSSRS